MAIPKTQMFREGAEKITPEESVAVLKFLNALVPGMLYVVCGECEKFKQVTSARPKVINHPTDHMAMLQIQLCEECR